MDQLPGIQFRVFIMTPNRLLLFLQDPSPHACSDCFCVSVFDAERSVSATPETWENECADHATALGTFGFVCSHNFATRWVRHTFDTIAYVDACNNVGEVLENA